MDNNLMLDTLGCIYKISNRSQSVVESMKKNLSLKQLLLIIALLKKPQETYTLNDIAGKVGITRQSAAKMINILKEKGFIELANSSKDKRAYEINLTEKANSYFKNNSDKMKTTMENVFSGISETELAAAYEVLKRIRENIADESK